MKTLFIMVLAALLSQCGFHLRGITSLPPAFQHVYISAAPEARFLQAEIEDQLRSYKVLLCPHKTGAHFQIIINFAQLKRQISNISSSTTPRQFQLFYEVHYQLIDTAAQTIIPNGIIVVTRLVTMNSERLLGSNYEQDFFLHEMQTETAIKLVSAIGHYFSVHHVETI